MQKIQVLGLITKLGRSPGEKKVATHSSIFAWKIPWTEEPGANTNIFFQNPFTFGIFVISITLHDLKDNFHFLLYK